MKKRIFKYTFLGFLFLTIAACVTQKKKGEISKVGKLYQNTTAYYNGYWNAKEIMRESMISLRAANMDNYAEILEVEDYVSLENPKMAKTDMDKIIEKVTTVAQLRENSDWVDDCYVMMGRAQYLKQEYETAEETLEYFAEDFNPKNPYGRNYKSKKPTGKALKRLKEAERKEKEKERKEKAEEREKIAEDKAKTAKEKNEARKKAAKEKAKQREKEAKERKKSKNKKSAPTPKSESTVKQVDDKQTPKTVQKTEKPKVEDNEAEKQPIVVKPEKDKTAFNEGRLWLAKTYIKRQNYGAAESILNRLSEIENNEEVSREVPAVLASLHIKQKEYSKALSSLSLAMERSDDKQNKARYAFIAGQIYQRIGDYSNAFANFETAAHLARDIKMEFIADLESLKTGILAGLSSKNKTISQLQKKLKDDKYVDFKDQIYFTIGEIEKSQNNLDEAIKAFQKSLSEAKSNIRKVDAYHNIAEIYLGQEKFLQAWNYYDSTSNIITKNDFRYDKVQNYTLNLKDIATQIDIIRRQDTLLIIGALEGEDQKKAAKKYFLENVKKDETKTITPPKSATILPTSTKIDYGSSNFFAYNENAKKKGKEDFVRIWGDRPLTDDWRRKAVANNSLANESANPDNSSSTTQKSPEQLENERLESSDEYRRFLRELPTNPVKIQEANDKIMNAMFALGKLFRDKIQNFEKSISTLENMHKKFGVTPFELESSYYLYLDYLDLNNSSQAQQYKSKILEKYRDSKYASILRDPEGYAKSDAIAKPDLFYNQVYKLFTDGKYQDAITNIDKASSALESNNPYGAKFALLRAMCLGSTQGKDAYIQGLMSLITTFPNSPEELKAKEILRFLGGDKSAFSSLGVQDVDKIYEKSDDEKHYIAVITYQLKEEDLVNVKIAISNYNKANYKLERLQPSDGILNIEENSQIILIRSFDNNSKAMEYYNKVNTERAAYLGTDVINVDIFPISSRNYRKMLSERNANGYRIFFEKNYLSTQK